MSDLAYKSILFLSVACSDIFVLRGIRAITKTKDKNPTFWTDVSQNFIAQEILSLSLLIDK